MNDDDKEWFAELDGRDKRFVENMLSPVGMGYRWMDACDKEGEYGDAIARELNVCRQWTYLVFRYFDAADFIRQGRSDYGDKYIRDPFKTQCGSVGFTLIVPRRFSPLVIYPLSVGSTFCEIYSEKNKVFLDDSLSNIEVEFVFERLIGPLPTQEEFEKISIDTWPDMVLWRSTVLRDGVD